MAISKGIKKLKYLLDINQAELAVLLNVTPCTVSLYENDKRIPNQKVLSNILHLIQSKNLDLKIEDFLV